MAHGNITYFPDRGCVRTLHVYATDMTHPTVHQLQMLVKKTFFPHNVNIQNAIKASAMSE